MQLYIYVYRLLSIATMLLGYSSLVTADCNAYTPAFPLPPLDPKSKVLQEAHKDIELVLREAIKGRNNTSFSIAVTSSKETLFELHHTAVDRDQDRPGAKVIDGTTCYRIASCTKIFTVLALLQQQKAGKLNLDDPINKYIAELNEPQEGTLPWKDITLRTLATQLSGIPRDIAQDDELVDMADPVSHGLPPLSASDNHQAKCDSMTNHTKACTKSDLLNFLQRSLPLFAPKAQSTYSNLGYELLALALSNITNTAYETLISDSVLTPLNMKSTTFSRPPDSVAALPNRQSYYWDVKMGIQSATGGLYSCTDDLATFIRYLLTHYNGLTPALNWIAPSSFSTGMNTFYGMPWEIFRTTKILPYTARPVTFVSKGGGLPGYTSHVVAVPDYDFGFVVLVAGDGAFEAEALEYVAARTVRAVDDIAQADLKGRYPGSWGVEGGINSSFALGYALERGLWVETWVSNGTDILGELGQIHFSGLRVARGRNQYLQLVPTLLFKDEMNQRGEIWRVIGHQIPARGEGTGDEGIFGVLKGDYCVTDIDTVTYGGLPASEVVFWDKREDGTFGRVELTGFRITLDRISAKEELVVQG